MSRRVHRGSGPLVVLMYHAIADSPADPFGVVVSPELFVEHVGQLAREFDLIGADELRTSSRAPRVVLTFDDGYVNNLEIAAPALAAAGAPGVFFVNTPRVTGREMWWDEILHAFEPDPACEFLEVDLGRRVVMDVRTPAMRAQAVRKLGVHLETMSAGAISAVLDDAYAQLGVAPQPCAFHRRMTDEQILELRGLGRFEIGGHTPNHVSLATIDEPVAQQEIRASFEHLTGLLGAPPTSFAYPFGNVGHTVSPQNARVVARVGYRQAFTTTPRAVPRWFDPYLVPRLDAGAVPAEVLCSSIREAMEG